MRGTTRTSVTDKLTPRERAARAALDCQTYGRLAGSLLRQVWERQQAAEETRAVREEAENVLAAVDAAAQAARETLRELGLADVVERWQAGRSQSGRRYGGGGSAAGRAGRRE